MMVTLGRFVTSQVSPSSNISLKPFPGMWGSNCSTRGRVPVLVGFTPGIIRQVGDLSLLQAGMELAGEEQRLNLREEP